MTFINLNLVFINMRRLNCVFLLHSEKLKWLYSIFDSFDVALGYDVSNLKKIPWMIKKWLYKYCLVALCICCLQVYGQSKNVKKTEESSGYNLLKAQIAKQTEDSLKLKEAYSCLVRSRYQSDTLGMANAYYFLSKLDRQNQVAYADSLIALTKDKPYKRYPANGYLLKGNFNYKQGDFKKALNYYLIASKYAKQNGNEYLYRNLKFNIGLLKNAAGDREEAKVVFAEYVTFLEENPKHKTSSNYNRGLFALADAYIHSKELDLAQKYIDKGIRETLKTDDIPLYSYLIVTSGIHQYLSKKYNKAIDSLKKGKKLIGKNDEVQVRVATCDYYIARSFRDMGKVDKSIYYFKKVDTVLKESEFIIPELIDTYDYLIAHYRSKDDSQQQIEYINTLLRLDSIKDVNQLYLTKNISERYDTAELIAKKEELIDQLEHEKFLKENTITILIVFLSVLGVLTGYWFWRSRMNKKRFVALLEKQKNKEEHPQEVTPVVTEIDSKEEIDIPAEVIEGVLKKLYAFESSHKFSKKHYTLNSLAKELNTNSAYLSKIINVYKHINFANYLNNLRVDFAVDQLTVNKPLRSYTIKAIAEEVGFKNAQSFSSAFHKRTGIYPSYFIKQLNS